MRLSRLVTPHNPIIVAGMHRSGTSMVASMLAASGISMGARLLEADPANPNGYFEDLDFLTFNRRLLLAATPEGALGHADWGWTASESLDRERIAAAGQAARDLIAGGPHSELRWGWKDPRTTLLLDLWNETLLQSGYDPAYLLLYRYPWDVADSMLRLGFDLLLWHPEYCYPIWAFYNRKLLEFYQKHRDRCLLVSTNALWNEPARFRALLSERFGIELPPAAERIRENEHWRSREGTDPVIPLVALTSGYCTDLLTELDRNADLPSAGLWCAPETVELTSAHSPIESALVQLSIVIPCYNDGEFLLEAIASVERCAPPSTELAIVNDGSWEPRTLDILRHLRRAGYQILDQANSGVAAARNAGICRARGRFILPLDSDDRLCPGFAEAAHEILEADPTVGLVYGDYREFGMARRKVRVPGFDITRLLAEDFLPGSMVFRRAVWKDCGGYYEGLRSGEQWDFFLTAAERSWQFYHLPSITFERRIRPNSLSAECGPGDVAGSRHDRIMQRHSALTP